MLRDADPRSFAGIYIVCGRTDLRYGIDSLAAIIERQFHKDLFAPRTLFLFCGRRRNRLKALVYEGSGFTLLYHRINENCGRFYWPMSHEDVLHMTPDQYKRLINGFTMDPQVRVTGTSRSGTDAGKEAQMRN